MLKDRAERAKPCGLLGGANTQVRPYGLRAVRGANSLTLSRYIA